MRSILLLFLGVPIPFIILIALFSHHLSSESDRAEAFALIAPLQGDVQILPRALMAWVEVQGAPETTDRFL